ncbi:MAG TPA: hypothetical protein VFC78_16455 [Tepidisphaeraceae bacterium]|nr:hypothetical protein [Tepidisphaeraceae bacterium]
MDSTLILKALADQASCYRRLAKLAEAQHEHIQNSSTEELLRVLQGRQAVLDQLAALEREIAPAKGIWTDYLATLPAADRDQAQALMAETRALLERITSADRNDVMVLQQRKLNLGRQIKQATSAQQVNRTYAAAYGKPAPRMDVQR